MKYSASKFNCFDDCKKKYEYKYVKKIKVPFIEQIFFEKGRYIHKLLEWYPQKIKFNFRLSSPQDIKYYNSVINGLPQKIIDLLKSQSKKEIKFNLDDRFTGFIDFIGKTDDNPIIIDWKTGRVYDNKSDDQLKIYALWLFSKNERINRIECLYYYVEHGKEQRYTYERDDLQNIEDYFTDKINSIESEKEFEKTVSRNCQYCDYFDICKPYNVDRRSNG